MKNIIYLHFHGIPIEEYDISLANRLIMWEVIMYLNYLHGFRFQIQVEEKLYKDLEQLIFLPNTTYFKGTFEELEILHKKVSKTDDPILFHDEETIKPYFRKEKSLTLWQSHYISFKNFQGFGQLRVKPNIPLFDHITFHNYIHSTVRKKSSEFITVHVRRGDGVAFPEYFWFGLSHKTKSFVKKGFYHFYDDEYYFHIIQEIQKVNPEQKFYICHDLLDDDMDYWKQKFGDKIFFKSDVYSELLNHFYDVPEYVVNAIIDLLTLFESPVKILNPESTFSMICKNYPDEKIKYILQKDNHKPKEFNTFINQYKRYNEKKII